MSLSSHIAELKKKHETADAALKAMQRRPAPDQLELSKLKKEKLHLKEEISRLAA